MLEEKKRQIDEYLSTKDPADYGAIPIGGDAYDTASLIVIRLDKHGLRLTDGGVTEDVSDKSVAEIIETIEDWAQNLREEAEGLNRTPNSNSEKGGGNMSDRKAVNVDVFTRDTLPQRLATIATEQGVDLGTDLIFVTTYCCPPSYVFEPVGSSPRDILAHLHKVAREEGVDLNEAAKRAFAEPQVSDQKEAEDLGDKCPECGLPATHPSGLCRDCHQGKLESEEA